MIIYRYIQGKKTRFNLDYFFFYTTPRGRFTRCAYASSKKKLFDLARKLKKKGYNILKPFYRQQVSENNNITNRRKLLTPYEKGKAKARESAIIWQTETAYTAQSYAEIAEACAHFEKLARRFGLVKEFHENGII